MSDDDLIVLDEERKKRKEILEKTGLEGTKKKWEQGDRQELAAVESRIAPPIFIEPRCSICSGDYAQYRVWIEQQLIKGRSQSAIARNIPPINGVPLGRRTVGKHGKEHMKLDQAIIRATLEEEADLIGQNFEEGVKGAITERGIIKVLIQKAYEDVLAGITTVEPKDMVQFLKLSKEFESNNSTLQYQEAENQVRIFMTAIRNVMLGEEFVSKDIGHAILVGIQTEVRALREREEIAITIENSLELPPRIVEAEVINDPTLPDSG